MLKSESLLDKSQKSFIWEDHSYKRKTKWIKQPSRKKKQDQAIDQGINEYLNEWCKYI